MPKRCRPFRSPWLTAWGYQEIEMPQDVKIAFERRVLMLPLTDILPMRQVTPSDKQTLKYKRIVASITEVGIVEPLVVARRPEAAGPYMLLEGHLRRAA